MKNATLPVLITAASFCLGFTLKTIISAPTIKPGNMKKVTGIGGIFFKCKDPKQLKEWYHKHLGLNTNPYGASFEWYEEPDSSKKAQTQWTPFDEKTKYFQPSEKDFMINYRVENLEALVEQLQKDGVTIVDKIETYDFGKFIHIMDAEGNKIELWEPIEKK
jgi:predicted enzyme related to lactoylglutathione lyase